MSIEKKNLSDSKRKLPDGKRGPGRPSKDAGIKVQSHISESELKMLDQMVEYLGNGKTRSDYLRGLIQGHIKDMKPVLDSVERGLLIPYYVKEKDKMVFIKKEDYQRGVQLGKHVIDM